MTRKEWVQEHYPSNVSGEYIGGVSKCPIDYPDLVKVDPTVIPNDYCDNSCFNCWGAEIPEKGNEIGMVKKTYADDGAVECIEAGPHILDSGDRTEFESGAVRDMREGKGRCDLMPLDVAGRLLYLDTTLQCISMFQENGDVTHLYEAVRSFCWRHMWGSMEHFNGIDKRVMMCEMFLEVAKHFEEGAKKYGDNNWRKGIPAHVYIDSAVRHYFKMVARKEDEPHDRAVAWNLMCCIWTCEHKPDLNDYANKETVN